MLKLEKIDTGEVRIEIQGDTKDIIQELFNGMIRTIDILVENGNLQEDKINNFIDDFGQQAKDIMMVKRAIKEDK